MHGRTIWTSGVTTRHTASAVHGIGAAITTLGTTIIGIGTDGLTTLHGIIMADGMTLGTMVASTIHGITEDSMTHGIMEDGTDIAT